MKELILKAMTHLLVYFPIAMFFLNQSPKWHIIKIHPQIHCVYMKVVLCLTTIFSFLRHCIITENVLQMLQWRLYLINSINTWQKWQMSLTTISPILLLHCLVLSFKTIFLKICITTPSISSSHEKYSYQYPIAHIARQHLRIHIYNYKN